MADQRRVRWDEKVLSKIPRLCRTSLYDKPLRSPPPRTSDLTNVDDDSSDTDDTLTDTDDAFIHENDTPTAKDGPLTDSDDTLNYMEDPLTDTDGALVNTDHTLTNTDDILIDKHGTPTNPKDDLTDTDDTSISNDSTLTDTTDTLPKTDHDSLTLKSILSLDGGGIKDNSTLTILQALMDEMEEIEQADKPEPTSSICASTPRPLNNELCAVPEPVGAPICERLPLHCFDYIGGTGSGNVIAITLAEGKMSVAEVMDVYRAMCAPGRKRGLGNKEVVFSEKRDKVSKWLHDNNIIAWASPKKHQESAIPSLNADPLYNNNNNNKPSRTLLENTHFRLLDASSADKNIYLLSIGSDPIDPSGADPSLYQLSKQIQTVHKELSLHTSPSNRQNALCNIKCYIRLDVPDADLADISLHEWGHEVSDERTVVRATDTYLQRKEIKDGLHNSAICLVNRRRFRAGMLRAAEDFGIRDFYVC